MNDALPFPELVEPATDWKVCWAPEQRGCVKQVSGILYVPTDQSHESRAIRAHELGHIKWSPPVLDSTGDVPLSVIVNVEEMRINTLLQRAAGVDMSALVYDKMLDIDPMRLNRTELAEMLITGWGLPRHEAQRDEIRRHDPATYAIVEEAAGKLWWRTGLPSFKDTLAVARWLHERFQFSEYSNLDEIRRKPPISERGDWGHFRILRPPLTVRVPTPFRARHRKRRAAREGSFLHAPHRLCLDRAVFDERRAVPGGTVLMDVSGSMRPSAAQVEQLVNSNPYGTLAMYGEIGEPNVCTMTILAERGHHAARQDYAHHLGGGNHADFKALEWLARQPKPRYWISDGEVTGIDDARAINLSKACYQLVIERQIRQFNNISHMMAFMAGKEAPLEYPNLVGLDHLGNER